MNLTVLRSLWFITFIPYLFLAGYSFFVRKNFLLGLLFVGLEVFYIIYMKGKIRYTTPEEKIMANFGRLAFAWMFILLFYFLFWLMWIPPIGFLIWAICTGKWEKVSKLRF